MKHKSQVAAARWLFWPFILIMLFVLWALIRATTIRTDQEMNKEATFLVHNVVWDELQLANTDLDISSLPVAGTEEGVTATARVSAYDVSFIRSDSQPIKNKYATWAAALGIGETVCLMAACLLGIFCAISFINSIKRDEKFSKRFIKALTWTGLMIIISAVLPTCGHVLQSLVLRDMLPNTQNLVHLRIHVEVTRLFFGIVILFLSQMLRINYDLKEEQELTI